MVAFLHYFLLCCVDTFALIVRADAIVGADVQLGRMQSAPTMWASVSLDMVFIFSPTQRIGLNIFYDF
jgi:hypothetical protein